MGMYCCCGVKLSGSEYEEKPKCSCDWGGWVNTCDWPEDRGNKDIPIGLPSKDGKYLVRYQDNGGDRYECEKEFTVIPRFAKGGYYASAKDIELHWQDESWEEGTPYAWKHKD